jgi:uncharacterized protein YjiS (DUF1127 family)
MINRLIAAYKNMRNTIEYKRQVRDTYNQLSALTTHELNDIGISRGEIYDIAHKSYNKPAKITVENLQVNENLRGFV